MTASLTITRAALSLPSLVITTNPFGAAFHLPPDWRGVVDWDFRRDYAPDSAWQSGKALLSVVREASSLPLRIYAQGSTAAELQANRLILEQAASQWSYEAITEVDGVTTTYACEPALPVWSPFDSGFSAALLDIANLVIPVNP